MLLIKFVLLANAFILMESSDTYRTILGESRGIFRDKGSKFISIARPVRNDAEIRLSIDELRKEFHDARHHSYAYALGRNGESWRANDDGEPSGTAGKPILGQIRSFGITHVLVVVPRYFGGTLLGTSGLINAYKTAAESALSNAVIIEHNIMQSCRLLFRYEALNDVMKLIKDESVEQVSHRFDVDCSIDLLLRLSATDRILKRLSRIEGVSIELGDAE